MTELEFDIEIARIRAESKATIEDIKQTTQLSVNRLEAALNLVVAEHRLLLDVVYASGDAQTIRDVNALLKALKGRFASLTDRGENAQVH